MEYENNDRVFTVSKSGSLSFGHIKIAREKVTKVPSDSSTHHLYQVIWDDYCKMWQWLEDVETPLTIYDRDYEVGDRVIYGDGQKGTVRKVLETVTLLTDSKMVIDNVKVGNVKHISTIYPSAMIEYQGWTGEVKSVTREILCQCEDTVEFTFEWNEPEIKFPNKKKKRDKNEEIGKSRIANLRVYPFHQENITFYPGSFQMFSKKQIKRVKWSKSRSSSLESCFKPYRKYKGKPIKIISIRIKSIEVFWSGYIPFLVGECPDKKISEICTTIEGSEVENVHALKPKELSSVDCNDFINFGHGSYFQYFPKDSDIKMEVSSWESQFQAMFIEPSLETDNLDENSNIELEKDAQGKRASKAIRVQKIKSSRSYEIRYWGDDTTANVTIPGWKLASDKRYCKVSTFKMGFPFVTRKPLFPHYDELGIICQKSIPDTDELKSSAVVWTKISPSGDIVLVHSNRESPYDLTYIVPPCFTEIGSILYNPKEDDEFKYGIITRLDILGFGKGVMYDPIRGYSVQDICNLRSVHRQDPKRNCMFWDRLSLFKQDTSVEFGDASYSIRELENILILSTNCSSYDECDLGNGGKYYESDIAPSRHQFYSTGNKLKRNPEGLALLELEKQKFETQLPDGIWICGYKNRADLLTVVFEGNRGSLLEDTLIIAEIKLLRSFPKKSIKHPRPYKIHFKSLEMSHILGPNLCVTAYDPSLKCDTNASFGINWNVLTVWDPLNSTLTTLLASIKEKFDGHLMKWVPEPARIEINVSGLQTEYSIRQKYNFELAMEIIDSIGHTISAISSKLCKKNAWQFYLVRRYYSQALIRIKNRYDKWISMDKKWLEENPNSKEIPNFPFLPLSKDFSCSVTQRLTYFCELLVEGNYANGSSLVRSKEYRNNMRYRNSGYTVLAKGFLRYDFQRKPKTKIEKKETEKAKTIESSDSDVDTESSSSSEEDDEEDEEVPSTSLAAPEIKKLSAQYDPVPQENHSDECLHTVSAPNINSL